MKRRTLLTISTVVLAFSAGMAFANSVSDDVVAQLARLGFSSITTQTTWLGRVRIQAERSDGHREIVLNPRTGEILRDDWMPNNGAVVSKPILDNVGSSSGGSGSMAGSGSGSGSGSNSGSGSGTSSGSGSDSGSDSGHDTESGDDKGSDNSSDSGSDDSGSDHKGSDN